MNLKLFEVFDGDLTIQKLIHIFGNCNVVRLTERHIGIKFGYGKNENTYTNILMLVKDLNLRQVIITTSLYNSILNLLITNDYQGKFKLKVILDNVEDEPFLDYYGLNINEKQIVIHNFINDLHYLITDCDSNITHLNIYLSKTDSQTDIRINSNGCLNIKDTTPGLQEWALELMKNVL